MSAASLLAFANPLWIKTLLNITYRHCDCSSFPFLRFCQPKFRILILSFAFIICIFHPNFFIRISSSAFCYTQFIIHHPRSAICHQSSGPHFTETPIKAFISFMDSIGHILISFWRHFSSFYYCTPSMTWQNGKSFCFDLAKPLNRTRQSVTRKNLTKWCNISGTYS